MRSCLILAPGRLGGVIAGADAVIVTSCPDDAARERVAAFIRQTGAHEDAPRVFPSVGIEDEERLERDLAALVPARPHGFVLTGAADGGGVTHLDARLAVFEAENGLDDGALTIVARIDTAAAASRLDSFGKASPRLVALTWEPDALAQSLGAPAARTPPGDYIPPLAQARTGLLIAARATSVAPIDAAVPAAIGPDALRAEAEAARGMGFAGKCALQPGQIAAINAVFGR